MLKLLLLDIGVPSKYGIDHCNLVYNHMVRALYSIEKQHSNLYYEPEKKLSLKLAALLHIVDNLKYFPKGCEHAWEIVS